jgi:hypothetical protein
MDRSSAIGNNGRGIRWLEIRETAHFFRVYRQGEAIAEPRRRIIHHENPTVAIEVRQALIELLGVFLGGG